MTNLDSIKKELANAEEAAAIALESLISQRRAVDAADFTHCDAIVRRNALRLKLRLKLKEAEAEAARAEPGLSINYADGDPLNPLVWVNGRLQVRFDSIHFVNADGATEAVFTWRGKQVCAPRRICTERPDDSLITLFGFIGYQDVGA